MPRPVLYVILALVAVAVLYAGRQLAAQALQPEFQSFIATPTLDEARAAGTLVGVYRAVPSDSAEAVPSVEAVYAVRPTKKALGPLLQTRTTEAEAVQVVARLSESDPAFRLAFDDGAGVSLRADGTAEAASASDTSASDLVQCCFAMRAHAPDRFWLVRDGERVVEFRLDA